MKLKVQYAVIAVAVAIPVFLAGCENKNDSQADSSVSTTQTNVSVDADNSGKNVRDRESATLTPGDQGKSDADREITQSVRKAVVSGTNDYSFSARNIKIMTVGGKVTLRGPVKTDAEKSGIVAITKNVAGVTDVDDQLEVKANP